MEKNMANYMGENACRPTPLHKPINGIGFGFRGLGFKVLQTRNVPPWAPPKPALEGMS